MENLKLNVNDFVSFLLKENENIQERIHIEKKDYEPLTNLKIQKLIYFIEASFLIKFNKQLFNEDYIAWDYGPVIPKLYKELKSFLRSPIFYENFKEKGNYKNIENSLTEEELNFLESSFIKFNKYSASELVSLSHIYGPWKEVGKNEIISKQNMINFFKTINE